MSKSQFAASCSICGKHGDFAIMAWEKAGFTVNAHVFLCHKHITFTLQHIPAQSNGTMLQKDSIRLSSQKTNFDWQEFSMNMLLLGAFLLYS